MAKQVVFHSRYTEHELIRRPRMQQPLPTGGWHTVQQRVAYQFHSAPAPDGQGLIGVLSVRVGADKMLDTDGWLAAEEDQETVRDAVDALRAHRAFGFDFWESGHAPGTKYPRPVDFRRDVMTAAVALDEEALVGMIAKERGSHHRSELIEEAEVALGQVREALAAAQAEAEAQAQKPKAKATA